MFGGSSENNANEFPVLGKNNPFAGDDPIVVRYSSEFGSIIPISTRDIPTFSGSLTDMFPKNFIQVSLSSVNVVLYVPLPVSSNITTGGSLNRSIVIVTDSNDILISPDSSVTLIKTCLSASVGWRLGLLYITFFN